MKTQTLSVQDVSGGSRFSINGALQFDTRDEGIYHEFLAASAALLAGLRAKTPLNALILGGGDGMALREVLGAAPVEHVHLVDHDAQVVELARTQFAPWNKSSLDDPRVALVFRDARAFLSECPDLFDLIVADFTYPESVEGAELYTHEFFSAINSRLSRQGVFATNAVSPEKTPHAFRSLIKTLQAANLHPLPLTVRIPSFIEAGYGDWGFLMASRERFSARMLGRIEFPASLRYLNAESFRLARRKLGRENLIAAAFSRPILCPADLLATLSMELDLTDNRWEWMKRNTLVMRQFDWVAFVAEVEHLLADLPQAIREELRMLKNLGQGVLTIDRFTRTVMIMTLLLTFVNAVNPDNAYAKGGFYRSGGHGSSDSAITWFDNVTPTAFRFAALSGALSAGLWNLKGEWKPKKTITFTEGAQTRSETFVLGVTDDIYVSESGEAFVTLWDLPYAYHITADELLLYGHGQTLVGRFPMDSAIFRDLSANIVAQKTALETAIRDYTAWMAWAGIVYEALAPDARVIQELEQLKKLHTLFEKVHDLAILPPASTFAEKTQNMKKLAPGVFLSPDGELFVQERDGLLQAYASGKGSSARAMARTNDMDLFLTSVLGFYRKTQSGNASLVATIDSILERLKVKGGGP